MTTSMRREDLPKQEQEAWDDLERWIKRNNPIGVLDLAKIPAQMQRLQEIREEFMAMVERMEDLVKEACELTEDSPSSRTLAIFWNTIQLNHLVRTQLPILFHFPIENMDAIIRAMEITRRSRDRVRMLQVMPYHMYLQTPEWEEKRHSALERAGYHCQLCNGTTLLNVHHRTYERRGRELPEDLVVLCRDCHAKFHDKLELDKSLFEFNG